ncbi:hypothetical protein GJ496_009888 [Pomphorhynchus laevis]|nr:hypothetical protein GJ496_009888 [Pomphorhynchus laevis]
MITISVAIRVILFKNKSNLVFDISISTLEVFVPSLGILIAKRVRRHSLKNKILLLIYNTALLALIVVYFVPFVELLSKYQYRKTENDFIAKNKKLVESQLYCTSVSRNYTRKDLCYPHIHLLIEITVYFIFVSILIKIAAGYCSIRGLCNLNQNSKPSKD